MDINQKVNDAKEKLQIVTDEYNHLLEEQKRLNSLPERFRLAEIIHSKTCHSNHIDQCGFDYENWTNNSGGTRQRYLVKADEILKTVPYATAIEVIKCL